jgi:hypothetical protein
MEYSLAELFHRKIELILIAADKLGYDFRKHQLNKALIKKQVKKAGALADKWSKQEKWVCVKPCKALKYKTAIVKMKR